MINWHEVTLMTQTQKVLVELIRLRRDNVVVLLSHSPYAQNNYISGGWAPVWYFQRPDCGGSDAGRQIRFLRLRHGLPIEMKSHTYISGNNRQKTIPIYRIGLTPEQIQAQDWTPAFKQPFNWHYQSITPIHFDHNGQGVFV